MQRADLLRAVLPWALLVTVLAVLCAALPVYWVYLLSTVAVSALVARGVGLVTSQVGIITLCQMSFAAIGGWAVSWLALLWPGAPFPLLVLIGGVVTAPVGLCVGAATVRIRGVELAVVTLGFAAALDLVLRQTSFPGVGEGTPVLPAGPFDDPRWFFALAWALLLVLQLGLAALGRTRHGLGWTAVRVSERAAASMGVRVGTEKTSAFAIGALFAGVAGGLLAGQYGLLTTSVFTPLTSMVHLATAVLCGAGVFGGALLAGLFAAFVPELLRRCGLPLDLGNALLAIGAFDVLRRGHGGLAEQLRARLQDRTFREVRVTCDLAPRRSSETAGASAPGSAPKAGPAEAAPCPPLPRLEITGLTVDFDGERALDGVDLTVVGGAVHALIGPNGAGKTTLVDAVTGLLTQTSGSISVDSAALDGLPAPDRARAGMRRTFQQSMAIEDLTVDEYLRLAAGTTHGGRRARCRAVRGTASRDGAARPVDSRGDRADPYGVAEFLGLPDGRVPVRLMDVGSRRVLEIAAALASRPRVLLLDEPASGLAESESLELARRLRRVPERFGCAVLLIEHDMAFVRAAASSATVLDEGRVVADGATEETLEDPRVVAAYLGEERPV